MAQQPHTEESIKHTEDEQNTGNHKVPGQPDTGGADKFGGTRKGRRDRGRPGGCAEGVKGRAPPHGAGAPCIGSRSWTRTNDLAINSRVLYQLSYSGSVGTGL